MQRVAIFIVQISGKQFFTYKHKGKVSKNLKVVKSSEKPPMNITV